DVGQESGRSVESFIFGIRPLAPNTRLDWIASCRFASGWKPPCRLDQHVCKPLGQLRFEACTSEKLQHDYVKGVPEFLDSVGEIHARQFLLAGSQVASDPVQKVPEDREAIGFIKALVPVNRVEVVVDGP